MGMEDQRFQVLVGAILSSRAQASVVSRDAVFCGLGFLFSEKRTYLVFQVNYM